MMDLNKVLNNANTSVSLLLTLGGLLVVVVTTFARVSYVDSRIEESRRYCDEKVDGLRQILISIQKSTERIEDRVWEERRGKKM